MDVMNKILPLAALIALAPPAFSEEGDTFESYGVCHIELADGSKAPIKCQRGRKPMMSTEDKLESIAMLSDFENSDASALVNKASYESSVKKKVSGIYDRTNYSSHVMQQAKKVKNGKFLVKIIFANEDGYPQKSSSNHKYFLSRKQKLKRLDAAEAAKWDDVIATRYIGEYYADYQASVDVVTPENVIITVTLDESSQLSGLIEGKNVRSIDHAGMPEVVYEEIKPSSIQN
jgi:hypothetical protein